MSLTGSTYTVYDRVTRK